MRATVSAITRASGRPDALTIPLALAFLVACGGPEPEPVERRAERPAPEAVAAEPPPPQPPEPLPRGACRVAGTSGVAPLPFLEPAASFDARGGMLVYRAQDRSVSALAISSEGVLGDSVATGWRSESVMHVVRVGERFAVVFKTECSLDEAGCLAIGVLDAGGRPIGEPHLSPWRAPGDGSLRPQVHAGALYLFRGRESEPSILFRFTPGAQGITEQRLLTIPAPPADEHRGFPYVYALAADGDRWALLIAESGQRGRRRLYASTFEGPVRVVLPLPPQWSGAALRMGFVADVLQIAGRASAFTPSHDTPAWIVELGLDGRARGPALTLSDDDTFGGNTVTASSWRGSFTRVDAIRRPIGEALALPSTTRDIIVAGEGRRFFVLREQSLGSIVAERIECEAGAPPSPAPRGPFEGDPDPESPCGPVTCSLSAPSLPALVRVVGQKCDRLAFGENPDNPDNRDSSVDATEVVHSRRIGDETIPDAAALRCARGLPQYQGTARWAFLAMRSGSGWTACEVGGGMPSLFDIGVSIAPPETAEWLEGGPPEVTVRVTVDDSASDGGELDDSTEERLHVCGLEEGVAVCWGSLPSSWRSASGSGGGRISRTRGQNRIEPDGRGHVAITPSDGGPARRMDVRRLRPGCRELPTDPEP